MATYNGRCLCGAVTATIAAEPVAVRHCLCRQCQKLSGGAGSTNAMFPTEAIAMQGALGSHAYVAASGNTLTQYFCAGCGTPVIATRRGSVPEIVRDGVNGFVIENVDEAVAAVGRLGGVPRAQVRADAEARFSQKRMVEDYLRVYEQMLTARA